MMQIKKTHKSQRLDDLEMHELLHVMYPDHIKNDEDEFFDLSCDINNDATVNLGDGFEVSLSEFLGRLVMLTAPIESDITGDLHHCFVAFDGGQKERGMIALVKRKSTLKVKNEAST